MARLGRGAGRDPKRSRLRNGRCCPRRRGRRPARPRRARQAQDAHAAVSALGPALSPTCARPRAATHGRPRVADLATCAEAHSGDLPRSGSPRCAMRTLGPRLGRGPRRGRAVPGVPPNRLPTSRRGKRPAALTKIEGEVKEARRYRGRRARSRRPGHACPCRRGGGPQATRGTARGPSGLLTNNVPDAVDDRRRSTHIDTTLAAHQARRGEVGARTGEATAAARPGGGRRAARLAAFGAAGS